MTEELTKAAQQALEQLEFLNACYPHKTAADAIAALRSAITQRPAAQAGEVDIKSRVSELIAEHGTLRAAARSLNIDVGYLSRLEHGDKVHPSSETLAKIGLRDAGVKYQRLVFLPTQPAAQATPEPDVAHLVASIKDDAKHAAYMAEIDNTDARDNYLHKLALSLDDLASRVHQQATPEPVGEPAAWRWFNSNGDQVTNWLDFKPSQKANVEAQVAEAGGRIEYAYTLPAPGVPAEVRAALEFYASGNHFVRADADAWETVSGEPPNFWEDEASTATIEDGTIARSALAMLAAQAKQ